MILPFVLFIVNATLAVACGLGTLLSALTTVEKDREALQLWAVATAVTWFASVGCGGWWYAAVWWPK